MLCTICNLPLIKSQEQNGGKSFQVGYLCPNEECGMIYVIEDAVLKKQWLQDSRKNNIKYEEIL